MRVAIIGAGGVGGYYGGMLARAGHDVVLFARGKHLDAITERGLTIQAPNERFTVAVRATNDVDALGACDFALVGVKTYSLGEVAPAVRRVADDGATVVPLLNGIGAAEELASLGVPRDTLVGGVTIISAARVAPGVIERFSPFHRVTIGEFGGEITPRVTAIVRALTDAGIEARATDAIELELWRKLLGISAMASSCGLVRASIGAVRDAPLGPRLIERFVREGGAVARARGVSITTRDEDSIVAQLLGSPAAMKPSFLLDLEAGGRTELDALSGTISRLAAEHGLETPCHDVAVTVLSSAERRAPSEERRAQSVEGMR